MAIIELIDRDVQAKKVEVKKKPEEAARLDPIDENMAVLYGKPIKAFPEQDHESHIAVHIQFLQDPSLGGNPQINKAIMPIMMAHIAEHIALLYRTRMQAGINMELVVASPSNST